MKYLTKELYNLWQETSYYFGYKPIADKEYSKKEIDVIYKKELNKYIKDMRESYDCPPSDQTAIIIQDILEDDNFDLNDWQDYDMETQTLTKPKSKEDVIDGLRQEHQQMLDNYNNREPFDQAAEKANFIKMYKQKLRYTQLPQWVMDSVDKRLLALDLMPKTTYNKLKQYCLACERESEKLNKIARKMALKASKNIPENISNGMSFHDNAIQKITLANDSLAIKMRWDGICVDGAKACVTITFKGAKILDNEGMAAYSPTARRKGCWLYDELYKTDYGYEAHIMLRTKALSYITLECKDILITESAR